MLMVFGIHQIQNCSMAMAHIRVTPEPAQIVESELLDSGNVIDFSLVAKGLLIFLCRRAPRARVTGNTEGSNYFLFADDPPAERTRLPSIEQYGKFGDILEANVNKTGCRPGGEDSVLGRP